jgi:hypothetical protein
LQLKSFALKDTIHVDLSIVVHVVREKTTELIVFSSIEVISDEDVIIEKWGSKISYMDATSNRKLEKYIFASFCSNFMLLGSHNISSSGKPLSYLTLILTPEAYFGHPKTI